MKTRIVVVPGVLVAFTVPQFIQRVDIARGTHGWQVRYPKGTTSFFSDGLFSSKHPAHSLSEACLFLASSMLEHPPNNETTYISLAPQRNKSNKEICAGVYGPQERRVKNKAPYASFSIAYPILNGVTGKTRYLRTSVYIGTQSTYSANYDKALTKAIERREKAIATYRNQRSVYDKNLLRENVKELRALAKELKG